MHHNELINPSLYMQSMLSGENYRALENKSDLQLHNMRENYLIQ